jgi:hypothetical protein
MMGIGNQIGSLLQNEKVVKPISDWFGGSSTKQYTPIDYGGGSYGYTS